MKTIIVSGIGGIVGQGIARSARQMNRDLRVVGINTTPISAGNHLCDATFQVPYAYDPNYVTAIQKIVHDSHAELIIPSTDYEAYYLARNATLIPIPIAASPAEVTHFCLDKYRTWEEFNRKGIPFAASLLPSQFSGQFNRHLVKPREGRGSRGIHLQPTDPTSFDDSYLVQELLEGPEITSTFYALENRTILGCITMVRELESGNTARAEVVTDFDSEIQGLAEEMVRTFPFRGSINIQAKVTPKGIVPFEINCRISGTNSIRSQFGFNDVAYTIQDFLFRERPPQPTVSKGSAMRLMIDVVYPGTRLSEIKNRNDQFYLSL